MSQARVEEPVMGIPIQLYSVPVHKDELVPSKLPLQVLHMHRHLPVQLDHHLRIHELRQITAGGNRGILLFPELNPYLVEVPFLMDLEPSSKLLLAEDVLHLGDEGGVDKRRPGAGPPVGFLLEIADEEDNLVVADGGDEMAGGGLGVAPELRIFEVPEDIDDGVADGKPLRALPAPEAPWPKLHLGFTGALNGDGEGVHQKVPAPRHCDCSAMPGNLGLVDGRDHALPRPGRGRAWDREACRE